MQSIEVIYNDQKYIANLSQGNWFSKPFLEILKDDKVVYRKLSWNNFVLKSFFCQKGITYLIQ